MLRLIVNADDFGISSSVNQAILRAYTEGILTSTSLMVTADAAEQAIAFAESHPGLAVGLHLVLVCGRSALPPEQIPHLVDANGCFPDNPVKAGLRYQFSRLAREELRREIRAQLEKFHQTGLPLSHVDGHLHLHMHPVVLKILAELATEFNIPAIRLPAEELALSVQFDRKNIWQKIFHSVVFRQLRRHAETILPAHIQRLDRVYGLLQTGAVTEDYLLYLIPRIRPERAEIYCHPAVADSQSSPAVTGGAAELAALLSPQVRHLVEQGVQLCRYSDLLDDPASRQSIK